MIEAMAKLSEINQRLPDPPSWSKEMSFAAYRRLVGNWENTVQNKYGKKAHLLLKEIEKDHVHVGLKEIINRKVTENLDFDLNNERVVERILDLIEEFAAESLWSRCASLVKEVRSL